MLQRRERNIGQEFNTDIVTYPFDIDPAFDMNRSMERVDGGV